MDDLGHGDAQGWKSLPSRSFLNKAKQIVSFQITVNSRPHIPIPSPLTSPSARKSRKAFCKFTFTSLLYDHFVTDLSSGAELANC